MLANRKYNLIDYFEMVNNFDCLHNYDIELAEQTRESRFLLNNYISGEKKKISVNGIEYEI